MNNHPRFTCKHFYKHQSESAQHRCTLCSAFHAPFRRPRAQCNGGCGKPDWARIEYKLAKQEACEPDLLWGQDPAQPPPPPTEAPSQEARHQHDLTADQQPMCAATAMMHGIEGTPSGPASSWQSAACPSIHEHRPWAPPATEEDVILLNPGYRVPANLWNLDIMERAHTPGPMAFTLATCLNNAQSRQSKLPQQWSAAS